MLLHHSLSILGFVWTLCGGKYGTELMATVCGTEVTNPLLQLRWFLRETGRYDTALGEVVDVLFMLSFFFLRIGVGSVLIYCYFQQPTDFMGRVGATSIYLISWVFWVGIFQYAVHKYTKKYRAWQEARRQCDGGARSDPGRGASVEETPSSSQGAHSDEANNTKGFLKDSPSMNVASTSASSGETSSNGLHHRSSGVRGLSNGTVTLPGPVLTSGVETS